MNEDAARRMAREVIRLVLKGAAAHPTYRHINNASKRTRVALGTPEYRRACSLVGFHYVGRGIWEHRGIMISEVPAVMALLPSDVQSGDEASTALPA